MLEKCASELIQYVNEIHAKLTLISNDAASVKVSAKQWSKKELIGHLIDSATNNHHRFVRAQELNEFVFPAYEQDNWVILQEYNSSSWEVLIDLWRLYNIQLAHVIKHINPESLNVSCTIGSYSAEKLEAIILDYLPHMKHHIEHKNFDLNK